MQRLVKATRRALRPLKWLFRCGMPARRESGRGLIRQARDIMHLRRHFGMESSHYYRWSLYRQERLSCAGTWVTQRRAAAINRRTAARANPALLETLENKEAFRIYCEQRAIACIATLARFHDGQVQYPHSDGIERLKGIPLFAKPIVGGRARGVRRWLWDGSSHVDERQRRVSVETVIQILRDDSMGRPYLLQQSIPNHPVIEPVSGGALCCVRALTVVEAGGPRTAMAMLVMSNGKSVAANFTTAAALGAPINLLSGVLGTAVDKQRRPTDPRLTHHPLTGAAIADLQLPFWNETKALAERVHREFTEVSRIGWDLAITPNGPVVLEGNHDMGVESLQTVHDRPLSDLVNLAE